MKKIIIAILALTLCVASVFAFAACNKGSDTTVVTVGYTLYEPMNYEDGSGTLIGFDTDLAKAVFAKLGYTVVFKEISWENKYVDLNSGTIDCIWNGFTANCADDDGEQRNTKVDFSYNYMLNAQCVVIRTADAGSLTAAANFANKTGYYESGSAGQTYATSLFDGINVTLTGATKQMDALLQVKSNSADFAVMDYQLANSIVGKGDYSNLSIISALTSESEYYAIGFKKGSELTAKVNSALKELAKDGTIATLAEKYGVSGSVITDFTSQD